MNATSNTSSEVRLLFVTLEFTFNPFSGNGLYARSLVKSILRTGKCSVRVICGKPHPSTEDLSADNPIVTPEITAQQQAALGVWPVELSAESPWKRLDKLSAWEEFARNVSKYAEQAVRWEPDAVVVVDWHGAAAWKQMLAAWVDLPSLRAQPPKVCYFNFRVYSSGISSVGDSAHGLVSWYEERERNALELSSEVICLSRGDCDSLTRLLPEYKTDINVKLLHPALREDMRLLSTRNTKKLFQFMHPQARGAVRTRGSRTFVTCCVRLSEEKNPLLFCQIMAMLRDFIAEKGLVPLLCGSASHQKYASNCKETLLSACPTAVIIDDFMGPKELAAIFSVTLLNFHPSVYDAFGMTVVEAAAFGVPSVMNGNGNVGAAELLGSDGSFLLNLKAPISDLAESLTSLLDDVKSATKVGAIARQKAVAWSESASANEILGYLGQLPN